MTTAASTPTSTKKTKTGAGPGAPDWSRESGRGATRAAKRRGLLSGVGVSGAKPLTKKKKRGAAMIEGVIVVATMLVFMGLITYSRQSYGAKLDLQMKTRANTLYFASHGCEGAADGASASASGSVPGSNDAAGPAAKSGQPDSGAANRSLNTASASANTSVSFQAVWGNGPSDLSKHSGSRSISAASKVTCNEKKYDNQWTAWAKFGMDFAMRLGGAGDLFK